jgi:hypothetical protein
LNLINYVTCPNHISFYLLSDVGTYNPSFMYL